MTPQSAKEEEATTLQSLNMKQAIQFLTDQQELEDFYCFQLAEVRAIKAHF